MIRVNLLRPRISAVPDATKPGRKPKKRTLFISGYEATLGGLLLAGGATAMYFYFDGQVGRDDPERASPAGAVAPDDLSADAADVAEPAEAAPDGAGEASNGGTAAPAAPASAPAEPAASPPAERAAAVAKRPAQARPSPTDQASSGSASSPLRLSDLKISNRGGDLKMTVALSGRPSYNKFQLDNPKRIVIDVANARVGLPRSSLVENVDHALVRRIRVGQFKQDPWVARLVLDVTSFPNLLLFPHSGGLDIQVSKSGQ